MEYRLCENINMEMITYLCMVLLFALLGNFQVPVIGAGSDTPSLTGIPCWTSLPLPSPGLLTPCYGEGMCRCNNDTGTADCSANGGNLTLVPYLPGDFQVLNFSRNKLAKISDENFFANASIDLRILDLYNNRLTYIVRGVFDRFPKIQQLLLGGNRLKWNDLSQVLGIPSLLDLDVKCSELGSIPEGTFAGVNGSRLRALDISLNRVNPLVMKELQPLGHLAYLYAWSNHVSELATSHLASLVALKLKKNHLFQFPDTCQAGTGLSLFPSLNNLGLEFNNIEHLKISVCLPKLKSLTLAYNRILHFQSNTFSTSRFPVLEHLIVAFTEGGVQNIEGFTFNNSVMTKLDFSYNKVNFSDMAVVSADIFGGCALLRDLVLTKNQFGAVTEERFRRLFEPISPSLQTLHLGQCGIEHLTQQFFSCLPRLTMLYLFENGLKQVPDGAFDAMTQLQWLDLDNNDITIISQNTFSSATRHRVRTFSLSGNPFECTCHLLWFKRWLISDPQRFDTRPEGYRCANLHGVDVRQFETSEQACMLGQNAAIFTIAVTCLFLSFLLGFLTVFRFRWRMRLLLYEACRGRDRERCLDGRQYQYDLFVAYAVEDLLWIQQELIPVLEGQWGLRLCVHQRDFIAGNHIVDNISDSVQASERVLVVFSPHFARSQWCQFELKFCQGCTMERDDVMVLVMLQETPSRDLTSAMLAVMQTTTYIEWDNGSEARASFWARLHLAIKS